PRPGRGLRRGRMTPLVSTDTALTEVLDPELARRITGALGHRTVGDLLHTLPRRHRRHGQRYDRRTLVDGERVTVIGTVTSSRSRVYSPRRGGGSRQMVTLTVEDGGTVFRIVFFSGAKIKHILPV